MEHGRLPSYFFVVEWTVLTPQTTRQIGQDGGRRSKGKSAVEIVRQGHHSGLQEVRGRTSPTALRPRTIIFSLLPSILSLLFRFTVHFNHRGRRNTYHHTSLISLDNVKDAKSAEFYCGKKIAYIYKAAKASSGSKFRVVWGKVMR